MNIVDVMRKFEKDPSKKMIFIEEDRDMKYSIIIHNYNPKNDVIFCRCKNFKIKIPEIINDSGITIPVKILTDIIGSMYTQIKLLRDYISFENISACGDFPLYRFDDQYREIYVKNCNDIRDHRHNEFKKLIENINANFKEHNLSKYIYIAYEDMYKASFKLIIHNCICRISDVLNYYLFTNIPKKCDNSYYSDRAKNLMKITDNLTYHIQIGVNKYYGRSYYRYTTIKLCDNKILIGKDLRYSKNCNFITKDTNFLEVENDKNYEWIKDSLFNAILSQ